MRRLALRRVALAAVLGVGVTAAPTAFGEAPAGNPAPDPTSQALAELAAPVAELDVERTRASGGATILRATQEVGGYPVLGAESVVARQADGTTAEIADDTVPGLEAPDPPRIARDDAIGRALAELGDPSLRLDPRAGLVVDRDGALAWRVEVASDDPFADREVLISAADGSVLGRLNLTRSFTGKARIHRDNPVVEQRSYKRLRDKGDENYPRLNRQRRTVELPHLQGRRGCLRGSHAVARAGAEQRSICRRDRDWRSVRRSGQSFEAVMAYWHVDRTRTYIDSLGLSRPVFDSAQRVNANSLDADNSYFSPMSNEIALGRGGVDDGEDGEIIVHEYGHAIQDAQVPGFGRTLQGASMGEGFGDYLAAATSADLSRVPDRFDVCVGEWDSTAYAAKPSCLRRVDSKREVRKANRRCGGDPHCIGEVWSSALWKLRGELGKDVSERTVMDRVTLESHFYLTPRAGFREGARALLAADTALYAGIHRTQIEREMEARGFCPSSGC